MYMSTNFQVAADFAKNYTGKEQVTVFRAKSRYHERTNALGRMCSCS